MMHNHGNMCIANNHTCFPNKTRYNINGWVPTVSNGGTDRNLISDVNLNPRPFGRRINSSPTTNIPAIVDVPPGTTNTLVIPSKTMLLYLPELLLLLIFCRVEPYMYLPLLNLLCLRRRDKIWKKKERKKETKKKPYRDRKDSVYHIKVGPRGT